MKIAYSIVINSLILSITLLLSCNNYKSTDKAFEKLNQEMDKYEGKWLDITGENKDTVTIVKSHDGEYQIGSLTGQLRVQNGKEYIYAETNAAEVQFIYDNTTSHLIMRSPAMVVEYKKVEANEQVNIELKKSGTENLQSEDNYIGNWLDITGENKDTITIVKTHDGEYQIGSLTGQLKVQNGKEYIYAETNTAEVQFIYDNTTSHLIMRSPVIVIEYEKVANSKIDNTNQSLEQQKGNKQDDNVW